MQAFAQFGSDLDAATQAQLARGERLVEILKQPQYSPMPVQLQVLSIFAVNNGFCDDLDVSDLLAFEKSLHSYVQTHNAELLSAIAEKGKIDEEMDATLRSAIEACLKEFRAGLVATGSQASSGGSAANAHA